MRTANVPAGAADNVDAGCVRDPPEPGRITLQPDNARLHYAGSAHFLVRIQLDDGKVDIAQQIVVDGAGIVGVSADRSQHLGRHRMVK